MDELISVIVPIYKVEQYLDKAVQSVLNQTYPHFELILVDDGSPDSCPQKCDEWAKKDKRIKVLHQPNGGLSDARNAGTAIASGEYVIYLDSDDYFAPTLLQTLLTNLKDTGADISSSGATLVYEDKPEPELKKTEKQVFEGYDVFDTLYSAKIAYPMTATAKLYKAELLSGLQFVKGKHHEDEFFIHHVLARAKKLVHEPTGLYYYLQREASIMGQKFNPKRLDAVEAKKQRLEFCKNSLPEFETKARLDLLKTEMNMYRLAKNSKLDKTLLKTLKQDFNKEYKNLHKKPLSVRIFRVCPAFYCFVSNKKHKSF